MLLLGLIALANALDSKQSHTSFGKLPLSVESTAPAYGFTQAKKDDGAKIYMGETTKNNNAGKQSPGPIYNYTVEAVKYKTVSDSLIHYYSLLDGRLETMKEDRAPSRNTNSMRMQHFSMTQ